MVDSGPEVNEIPGAWLCPRRYRNGNINNVKKMLH